MDRPKRQFSIQEASRMLRVPKHTLRFWEKEFQEILSPLRTKGGQRRYTAETIAVVEEIKRLRAMRMNLAEIREVIGRESWDAERVNTLADRVADLVKSEVCQFIKKEFCQECSRRACLATTSRGRQQGDF